MRVDDIQAAVLHHLADRDVFLYLRHMIIGDETDRFRRSVPVDEYIRRYTDVYQFLAAGAEHLERMVVDIVDELPCHLGGHERVGDAVLLEIIIESNEVEPQLLRDDIYCTAGV